MTEEEIVTPEVTEVTEEVTETPAEEAIEVGAE